MAADDEKHSIQNSYPCPRLAFEERSKLQLMLPASAPLHCLMITSSTRWAGDDKYGPEHTMWVHFELAVSDAPRIRLPAHDIFQATART